LDITAIYPGSFDPITNGHIDIITRGLEILDGIIIAIMRHSEKTCLFSVGDRKVMIEAVYREEPRIEADIFDGLLVDYARHRKA